MLVCCDGELPEGFNGEEVFWATADVVGENVIVMPTLDERATVPPGLSIDGVALRM